MKTQTLYSVAGLIWGLVLGPDAGLYAARVMGSVAWLYQYEDGAWADWVIIPFGTLIGLTVLFSCYQLGAAVGRRQDDMDERRPRPAKSVPWAVIVVGVAVGAATAVTIDERQRAVAQYVRGQKDAAAHLLVFAETLHRVTTYSMEWPGGGEAGRIDLSFKGKRQGNYRFAWKIFSQDGTTPLLGDSYTVGLDRKRERTNIPVGATDLINAYVVHMRKPAASLEVDERFRLVLELRPILTDSERDALPEDEPARLDDGESILVRQVETAFLVQFEARGGRIVWRRNDRR
jgi:hypothetical protein